MQPVLLVVVFTVTVGQLPGVGPAGIPYPLFAFAGLVPWTLFSASLASASNSLVNSESIILRGRPKVGPGRQMGVDGALGIQP
jgi:lipopolysaccharide transport system permease protein